MPHLLLFDIDGTLVDTRGAGQRAMQREGEALFGEGFGFDGVDFAGRLDPSIFGDAARLHGITDLDAAHDAFRAAYVPALAEELAAAEGVQMLLPGVHELLGQLQPRVAEANGDGVTLGLVTGNYADAAPVKLRHVGIDPTQFTTNGFGDEGPTRPDLVAVALRRYEQRHGQPVPPKNVIVLGDTEHDVHCAKAHGCVALGVLTGRRNEATLRDAGADVVLEDLSDPTALWELLTD